jgi:hypothetical protein
MDDIHSFKRIWEPTFGGKGCDDTVPLKECDQIREID